MRLWELAGQVRNPQGSLSTRQTGSLRQELKLLFTGGLFSSSGKPQFHS